MKLLETALISVLAIFAPIQSVIMASFILITLDLITGILAAKRKGEPITSSNLKRSVGKIFLYELAIILAFMTEKYLVGGDLPVSKLVTSFIGITELKSILENLDAIQGQPFFTTIISKLAQTQNNKMDQ